LVILYKSTEYAEPGYYNATLKNNINIELTSTQRAGVHRYRFT
jgi:putative alpha-1,2-mannosidase